MFGVSVLKKLVFDLEADHLLEKATRIWVCCTKDLDTGEEWHSTDRDEIIEHLGSADVLIGQNIIEYDIPLMNKIWGWEYTGKVRDTLVMSRLEFPDRPGGHGLAPWGERLGRAKPEHEDWTQYSEAMLHRCKEDVRINYDLYLLLEEKLKDFGESVEIEHEVQRIIAKQQRDGCYFDQDKCRALITVLESRIEDIDGDLSRALPYHATSIGTTISKPFKKDGTIIKRLEDYADDDFRDAICGPFTRIEWKQVDLNSDKQKKEWLLSIGWKPTEWNTSPTTGLRTSPKLTEDSYDSIPGGIGEMLSERSMLSHRLSLVKGLLGHVREDGRISAGANTIGTNTGRMRQRVVVNIPSTDASYGKECRELFSAPPNRKFVGYDASGLELRMLAHYMNDPEFTEQVLHGDIHSYNQRLAGLPTRNSAKTLMYAFLYGAGDAELGRQLNCSKDEGTKLRNRFLSGLPKLGELIDKVKQASKRGYFIGLDGRKVHMRRNKQGDIMEHKALNTLLQSAGAIVMKKAMVLFTEAANDCDYIKCIDMHDENQCESSPEDAELLGKLGVQSIIDAGKHFNLNIPLDGEYAVGQSWADTH